MAKLITDYPVETNVSLYVTSVDGSPKGWRVDLLEEKLSSKLEEKVLLCSCCKGLLRDACICDKAFMCHVCIPEETAWLPAEMNREIVNERKICCPLKQRGCVWSDTVSAAVNHLEGCPYLPTACPLGCVCLVGEREGQVARLERRHIPGHVRDSCPQRVVTCEFCEGEVKASEMNPHLEDCESFPLPCPNGCAREGEDEVREVKRRDLTVHLDTHCPLQIVQCPYRDHGCREEMERRLIDTHEREFLHIHFKLSTKLLTNRIATLEKQNSDKDLKIASLTLFSLQPTLLTRRLEWNIQGVQQKIQNKETTYSDPFYVGLYKCQCSIKWSRVNVGFYGGNVVVRIHIMRGDFDDKLYWPIRYKYNIALINQINSKDNLVYSNEIDRYDLEMFPDLFKRPTDYRNEGYGPYPFISNTEILEVKYCKQDSITLHISVELLASL